MNLKDYYLDDSKAIRRISDAIIEEVDRACIEALNKVDDIGQQKLDKLKKNKNLIADSIAARLVNEYGLLV